MEGKLNQLFENYLNNQSSDEEIIDLLAYFKIPEHEPVLRELITRELGRSGAFNIRAERVEERLDLAYAGVKKYIDREKQPVVRKMKLWPRMVAVAAMSALILSGLYFFNLRNDKVNSGDDIQNLKPGRVGATLTLADGKKIRLDAAVQGALAEEAGVSISKSADGQLIYEIKGKNADPDKINTLSTANGETYKVRLPDGSLVYLNAASSLTYAASLIEHGRRVVKLSGEGYFEISKDKAHPFVVKTERQDVEVLGTHFNVNAYTDEPAFRTTLLEGAVKVTAGSTQQLLKPGFQAVNDGTAISVEEVNTEGVVAWKEGDFYFENVDFRSVMRKIARWYDVELVYDKSVPAHITSNGVISRNTNLPAVLKLIERSGQVTFKIKGRKLFITK